MNDTVYRISVEQRVRYCDLIKLHQRIFFTQSVYAIKFKLSGYIKFEREIVISKQNHFLIL